MKKLLIVLVLVFTTGTLFAQTFDFYRISPPIVNGDTSLFNVTATKAIFKNTGTTSLNFTFCRVLNQLPAPDWSSSICVGTNCFASFLDTIPPRNAPPITMAPGTQDTMILDFNGITVGTGKVVIKVWVNSNPSNFKIDTFQVHLGPVGIKQISSVVEGYSLEQNYPNPFNPTTKINFSLQRKDNVSLKVYDVLGNVVADLIKNEALSAGKYSYDFNSSEFNLSSGVYYYILKTEAFSSTKKMMLIK